MSEHTKGYCWAHHKEFSLQADCPGCAAEEDEELEREECPLCTEIVTHNAEDEGFDCPNCGAHWVH